jgi:uncharacterized protein
MKKLSIILLILLSSSYGFGQDISGQWNGALKIQNSLTLRLIFHITETEEGYAATMDSPDQNSFGNAITSVTLDSGTMRIKIDEIRASYTGTYEEGAFIGKFSQGGQSFPLHLSREAISKETVVRPQEPVAPYPYRVEEVLFPGGEEGVELAGTLTLPHGEGPFPVVVLISGSGPQNRDEEFMKHKPFLVLADHLTRNGIGVLRYDDRGYAGSTGNYAEAISLDFADDAQAALSFLKQRPETGKLGLAGHSEGGLVAPIVASRTQEVDFIILLAGPGVTGKKILLQQIEAMGNVSGLSPEQIRDELTSTNELFNLMEGNHDDSELPIILRQYLEENIPMAEIRGTPKNEFIDMQVSQMTRPWFRYFISHDPNIYLKQVKCPVLAINGSKDVQVTASNLAPIAESVRAGGNTDITLHELNGLNHLFQECSTGAMSEYADITQTFSPHALNLISDWILNHIE